MVDYDSILEIIGPCGRYQLLMFALLATTSMKAAFDIELLIFYTYTPTFYCSQPGNLSVGNSTLNACSVPGSNTTSCTAWTYDQSVLRKTMVTEFDLVCNKAPLAPLVQSLIFVGAAFGMMLTSFGDLIGRKKIIIIQGTFDLILSFALAFVPGLEAQFTLRILRALSSGIYCQGLSFCMELVGTKYRACLGCNYWIFWCIGYAGSALIGKFVQDWRYMQLASCIVAPIYLFMFIVMCESPRWLIVKGRKKEACETLLKMARWNGRKDVTVEQVSDIKVSEDVESSSTFKDIFKSRTMMMKIGCSWMLLWSFSFSYFGMAFDSTFASKDIFINMAVLGLIEIPASPLAWVIGDKLGRRNSSQVMLIFSAIVILVMPHFPKNSLGWLKITVGTVGKMILTAAYSIVCVFVSELLPTSIRNVGYFSSLVFNSLGTITAPQVLFFGRDHEWHNWVPSIVFGGFSLLASFIFLLLPETVNLTMPQTIEEADLLVRGREAEYSDRLKALNDSGGAEEQQKLKNETSVL